MTFEEWDMLYQQGQEDAVMSGNRKVPIRDFEAARMQWKLMNDEARRKAMADIRMQLHETPEERDARWKADHPPLWGRIWTWCLSVWAGKNDGRTA